MSRKVTRFSTITMMAVLAPLAFAGCLDPQDAEADEPTSGEVMSEAKIMPTTNLTIPTPVTVVCNSGWPGTRGCVADINTPGDIFPLNGFPFATVSSGSGDLGHSVSQTGPRKLRFVATIAEGDLFNPGKNNTQYLVFWAQN